MRVFFDWFIENSLLVLLSLASVFTALWLMQFRERLKIKWPAVLVLTLLHVGYGVLCVRLFAAMEGTVGGMSLFGAVFFMPLAYFLGAKATKRSMAEVFDIFGIAMIATLLFARCNCLASGCCLGRLITSASTLRWPTRELEIIYYIAFLICFIPKVTHQKTQGSLYPVYMLTYGVFRFIIEFFRVSNTNQLFHLSHLWAALAAIVGLSVVFEQREDRKKHHQNSTKGGKLKC